MMHTADLVGESVREVTMDANTDRILDETLQDGATCLDLIETAKAGFDRNSKSLDDLLEMAKTIKNSSEDIKQLVEIV